MKTHHSIKGLFKTTSLLAVAIAVSSSANAQLTITNGDFQADPQFGGWFRSVGGNPWEGVWDANVSPDGSPAAIFSNLDGGGATTASANALNGIFLYQSIGTAGGATELPIQFNFGRPTDDNGTVRVLGISVAIYAYDGIGTFSPANNVGLFAAEAEGGSGVTRLDSVSFVLPIGDVSYSLYTAELDISGAGSQELFLHFNNYRPADTESWPYIDNVAVVPEPSTYALIFGALALAGVMVRRRIPKD